MLAPRKIAQCTAVGNAVAKNCVFAYRDHPELFPEGIKDVIAMAKRIGATSIGPARGSGRSSEEEEELTGTAAAEECKRLLGVEQ